MSNLVRALFLKKTFQFNDKDYNGNVAIEISLPIIIKVNPKGQNATYELDKEVLAPRNRLESQTEEDRKKVQPKPKGKEKKNKTKPKEEGKKKPVTEMTEKEQRQAMGEVLDNMARDRGLI